VLSIIFRGHDEPGFFAHAIGMNPDGSPLRLLPGNQRSDDARYACLVVMKDYFRMRADSKRAGNWHYSALDPAILADVRAGRAVLVFDLSNEGPAYEPDIFSELFAWIDSTRLPHGRCVWLSQNRVMSAAAKEHVGPRSAAIHFEHFDYFVKLMAWNFSLGTIDSSVDNDPASYLERLVDVDSKDRLLLCLNATPRLGRVLTLAALHHNQLMEQSLVSFAGMSYVKSGVTVADVLAYVDENPNLKLLEPWVHAVGCMAPIRVDTFEEQGNALVEKIDGSVYRRTFFSLVTESDFTDQSIERVTEKTVKAFCMGHPTLIVGNPHSFPIVRNYGFQDWSPLLDGAADSILNAAYRFELVMAEVLRQAERITANPRLWIDSVREISVFNHRYAISGKFLQHYIKTVDQYLIDKLLGLLSPSCAVRGSIK